MRSAHTAAIDPTDEGAVAVEQWAEANAHLEDEVMEAQERKQDEDPVLLGDLEDEAQEAREPQAEGLNQPASPTWEEKQMHCLTHMPYQPWCEVCVAAKAKEDKHTRDKGEEEEGTGVVQIDYCFLSISREGQEAEDESKLITMLVMVDVQSGWPYCMQLPDKSSATAQSRYVLHCNPWSDTSHSKPLGRIQGVCA